MYRPTYNVIRHYFHSDNISREKSTIIAFYHIALNIKDYYWMTNDQTLVSRRSISPLVIPNNLYRQALCKSSCSLRTTMSIEVLHHSRKVVKDVRARNFVLSHGSKNLKRSLFSFSSSFLLLNDPRNFLRIVTFPSHASQGFNNSSYLNSPSYPPPESRPLTFNPLEIYTEPRDVSIFSHKSDEKR